MEFFKKLYEILKQDSRFVAEDGQMLKSILFDSSMNMDAKLLKLLLENNDTKGTFFTSVDGILVFDKVKFAWILESKEFLPDSYTIFTNKIGIADNRDRLLSKRNDITIVWPYKDCVLEGGQTKEDQKREEIFYNETLAPEMVRRLLYPKVFTNSKTYSRNGIAMINSFDEKDNLIIKGNNLLVLSSLLERFEGKIKCVYIDPPYYFHAKKNEDSFQYNSNFKLSTWLTFMKNRLEIAKRLLSDDGAIFVQISDDGVAELHMLLKDIFNSEGNNNFINKITVKTKSPSGFASVNPGVFETSEYILSFAKNKKKWTYNPQFVESSFDENYKWYIANRDDDYSSWQIKDFFEFVAIQAGYENKADAVNKLGKETFTSKVGDFALQYKEAVFQLTAIGNDAGQKVVEIRDVSKNYPTKIYAVERENKYTVYIFKGREIAFYSKKVRLIDGENSPSIQLSNIWIDTPYEGIAKEGGVTLKGGKKPEKLIKRIIEMSTNEGDIILDYHLGSGTTAAVAHKLKRQYIGVEQLDYEGNSPVERLKNVIAGEKTGISKLVNWQGGGSFIYCELKTLNDVFIDEMQRATQSEKIVDIFRSAYEKGLTIPYVSDLDISSAENEFQKLSIFEKKRAMLQLLDKNKMYVNMCDIDDIDYSISDVEKEFSHSFYRDGKQYE